MQSYKHDLTMPEMARCFRTMSLRAHMFGLGELADYWSGVCFESLETPDLNQHVIGYQSVVYNRSMPSAGEAATPPSKKVVMEFFNDRVRALGFCIFSLGDEHYWNFASSDSKRAQVTISLLAPRSAFDISSIMEDIQKVVLETTVKARWSAESYAKLLGLERDGPVQLRRKTLAPAVKAQIERAGSATACCALAQSYWKAGEDNTNFVACEFALTRALALPAVDRIPTLLYRADSRILLARSVRSSRGIGYGAVAKTLLVGAVKDCEEALALSGDSLKWRASIALAFAKLALGPNEHALGAARLFSEALKGARDQAQAEALVGRAVRISGLTGAQELNGRDGTALRYDEDVGRLVVDLAGKTFKVKAGNLEATMADGEGAAATQRQQRQNTAVVADEAEPYIPLLKSWLMLAKGDAKAWLPVDASLSRTDSLKIAVTTLCQTAMLSLRCARVVGGTTTFESSRSNTTSTTISSSFSTNPAALLKAEALFAHATVLRHAPKPAPPKPANTSTVSDKDANMCGRAVVEALATAAALVRADYFTPRVVTASPDGWAREEETLSRIGEPLEKVREAGRIVALNIAMSCEELRALVFLEAPWSCFGFDTVDAFCALSGQVSAFWGDGADLMEAAPLAPSVPVVPLSEHVSEDDLFMREYTARQSPTGSSVTMKSVANGVGSVKGRSVGDRWADESPRVVLCFASTVLMRLATVDDGLNSLLRDAAANRIISLLDNRNRCGILNVRYGNPYLGFALTRASGCGRFGKPAEPERFAWFVGTEIGGSRRYSPRPGALAALAGEMGRAGDNFLNFQTRLAEGLDEQSWRVHSARDVLEVVRIFVLGGLDGFVSPPLEGSADLTVDRTCLAQVAGAIFGCAHTFANEAARQQQQQQQQHEKRDGGSGDGAGGSDGGGNDRPPPPAWAGALRELLLTSPAGLFLLRRGAEVWASGQADVVSLLRTLVKKWFKLDGAAKAGYRWDTYPPATQRRLIERGVKAPVSQQEAWEVSLGLKEEEAEENTKRQESSGSSDGSGASGPVSTPQAVSTHRACAHCHKANESSGVDLASSSSVSKESLKLSSCSGCKAVEYCSRECQKSDWKEHKAKCSVLRDAKIAGKVATAAALKANEGKVNCGPAVDLTRNILHMASIQEALAAINK